MLADWYGVYRGITVLIELHSAKAYTILFTLFRQIRNTPRKNKTTKTNAVMKIYENGEMISAYFPENKLYAISARTDKGIA